MTSYDRQGRLLTRIKVNKNVTEDVVISAVAEDGDTGFCLACGS